MGEVKMRTRKRPPLHPGRILYNNYLEPLDISVTKMAEILGVSRKTLSNIVNEHKSVTPEMALRLSKALNTTPDLWLNLQKNYDLWHTARETQAWKKVKPVALSSGVSSLQA
jgi:addiction module HigA family antidote